MTTSLPTPLAVLRRKVADDAPLAPVHAALHTRLTAVDEGSCSATMPTVAGDGLLESVLVLADFTLGIAYSTTLRAGDRLVTVRLGVQLLARPHSGQELRAHGTLDDARGGVGLSSSLVTDRGGRPVARTVGRNALITDDVAAGYGRSAEVWASRPSPWRLLMPHRGEGPTPDGTMMVARPDPTAVNAAGVVQGGVLAGLAARGLTHALEIMPDDFAVSFVRPARADGSPVTCRVVVEHRGRRLRVGRADLVDGTGRLLATASGTVFRA